MDEIRVVELFSERYGDVDSLPLSLLQWFFSRLNTPIRLGPIRAGNRAVIVTKVLGEFSSSEMRRSDSKLKEMVSLSSGSSDKKKTKKESKKTREIDLVLIPDSTVALSYSTYRVALCLDVSRTVFSLTDCGFPFAVLQETLLSFVQQLSQLLAVSPTIQHLYLAVFASNGSSPDNVFHIWQGDLQSGRETENVALLLRLLKSRIAAVQEDALNELQAQSEASSRSCGDGAIKRPAFADLKHFTSAIGTQLQSLPHSACPIAVLLTSGNIKVQTGAAYSLLPQAPATLHVILENISPNRSRGHYTDLVGLAQAVEEIHSGSLTVIDGNNCSVSASASVSVSGSGYTSAVAAAVSSVVKADFFVQPVVINPQPKKLFWGDSQPQSQSQHFSYTLSALAEPEMDPDPSDLNERQLGAYHLHGVTAEHLLCLRLSEGFTIMNISQEMSGSGSSGTYKTGGAAGGEGQSAGSSSRGEASVSSSADRAAGAGAGAGVSTSSRRTATSTTGPAQSQSGQGRGRRGPGADSQSTPAAITVCLRKKVTKLTSLVYEITFSPRVKSAKPTSFGVRKLQSAQAQAQAKAQRERDQQLLLQQQQQQALQQREQHQARNAPFSPGSLNDRDSGLSEGSAEMNTNGADAAAGAGAGSGA